MAVSQAQNAADIQESGNYPNPGESALKKVQAYVETVKSTEYNLNVVAGTKSYDNGLERTLKELQEQCRLEEARSKRLRNNIDSPLWDEASSDANVRLRQLQVISAGFRSLAEKEPQLPLPGSCLPALLAAREIERLISETQESIPLTYASLAASRQDLSTEQADLSNALLLTEKLEKRVESLRVTASQRAKRSPEEVAQLILSEEREQAQSYSRDHRKLTGALGRFVDAKLAPLIAAEELGGPVAGSTLDISEDVLAAGFTTKGKPNKSKKKLVENARQLRIDKMFGSVSLEDDEGIPKDEIAQAALAVKELLGELLQVAIDYGSGRYVTVERETAASRFLVRAKVAVLDPRDARKIRLIDFAKTLDD